MEIFELIFLYFEYMLTVSRNRVSEKISVLKCTVSCFQIDDMSVFHKHFQWNEIKDVILHFALFFNVNLMTTSSIPSIFEINVNVANSRKMTRFCCKLFLLLSLPYQNANIRNTLYNSIYSSYCFSHNKLKWIPSQFD